MLFGYVLTRQVAIKPLGSARLLCRTAVSRAGKSVADPVPAAKAQKRFPRFMAKYAVRLREAPISHVSAFLLVHELTAIVPLFGIWGTMAYFDYLPTGMPDWVIEAGSNYIRKLAERNDWTFVTHAERGSRLILQGAAAYGIVKAIMPLRLVFSLWCMPWTARRIIMPFVGLFKRKVKPANLPKSNTNKQIGKQD